FLLARWSTDVYTLSLHDALPISATRPVRDAAVLRLQHGRLHAALARGGPASAPHRRRARGVPSQLVPQGCRRLLAVAGVQRERSDRKSTRLNSSHVKISYAVFCL